MEGSYTPASQLNGSAHLAVPAVLHHADLSLLTRTDASVLFTGRAHVRTLAMKIHNLTGTREGTFHAVDCGATSDVLDRELFDVLEKDRAFRLASTGARICRPGTLFLHEVGHLPASAQARLRDAISVSPSATPDAPRFRRRIIASTSDPLLPRVLGGAFDDRLFYLLNVMHFDVRPSRHRRRRHGQLPLHANERNALAR